MIQKVIIMYIKRALEAVVTEMSSHFPIVLITGPRQIGKTTLLKQLAEPSRSYISLDDPLARNLACTEPLLFLQRYTPPLIIDEIQYAPQLLPILKLHVDQQESSGLFWLTGSQTFHLMREVRESLAGRVGILPMQGLSNAEIKDESSQPFLPTKEMLLSRCNQSNQWDLKTVYERIFKGSMPALYKTEQDVERFYASYVDTYIYRDIKELTQVADELQFQRFLVACAARTSQMLNYSELARDVGISSPTAKKWLSLLVSSGLVVLIEPYYNNLLKRMVKAPNLYFLDTGLCAYLTRWTSSQALEVSAMSGAFFETFVVSEIIKSYLNYGKRPPIYYYRDSDQKEIDLLIEENGVIYPIEIKKSAHPTFKMAKHFSVLNQLNKQVGLGTIVCMSNDLLPLKEDLWAVPVWMI